MFRDLEALVRAWETRDRTSTSTGVVHVGFERAPARNFDTIANAFSGYVLLTASAKFSLPSGFQSSSDAVGNVEGQPIYLAIRGWGYEAEDIKSPEPTPTTTPVFRDWVAAFVTKHPDMRSPLAAVELVDEESYQAAEMGLSDEARVALGMFRLEALIGDGRNDPCALARAAPPWLRLREFERMEVTVRVRNAFRGANIRTVADLGDQTVSRLLKIQNFGRTSIDDLLACLRNALSSGPYRSNSGTSTGTTGTLLGAIEVSLAACDPRARDVLVRRMGLRGKPQALVEIGEVYNVTRERIRQIEAKTIAYIRRSETWSRSLADKFGRLLREREFPVPLLGVEAIDRWFLGVSEVPAAVRYILDNFCTTSVSIVEVDGVEYLGFLDQARWQTAMSEARRRLLAGANKGGTEEHCKSLAASFLPAEAAEFRGLLWEKVAAP